MVNIILNFVLIISMTVYGCEQSWKSFNHHCYALVERLEPWHAAMEYCTAFSASLVTIDDHDEFVFLQNTLRAHHRANDARQPVIEYWTGGNNIINEGQWVWAPNSEPMSFKPWAPGEPDRDLQENCAGLYNHDDFLMNNDNCDFSRFFICENEEKPNGEVVG
ncbi:hypothetical protein ACJMK2_041352 [Sinanodonta woodiana]|uniref:C-type lectin domain-containing protein n=1 Tax=Sinanodonta woodiana TaxID=1069815 RepID=A0ABD3W3V0_SINWO